ncbi:hypothetical protein [Paraburkholderia sp. UCT31]|uniref:hypothetical protein n=1 Tax=Paraburkholderia sp. UCT31 TaxID=2615209 RepID=UPI001CA3BA34
MLTAFVSHAVGGVTDFAVVAVIDFPPASHFFMNDVFAAPVNGFPALLTAWLAHVDDAGAAAAAVAGADAVVGAEDWANATPIENIDATATASNFFMTHFPDKDETQCLTAP